MNNILAYIFVLLEYKKQDKTNITLTLDNFWDYSLNLLNKEEFALTKLKDRNLDDDNATLFELLVALYMDFYYEEKNSHISYDRFLFSLNAEKTDYYETEKPSFFTSQSNYREIIPIDSSKEKDSSELKNNKLISYNIVINKRLFLKNQNESSIFNFDESIVKFEELLYFWRENAYSSLPRENFITTTFLLYNLLTLPIIDSIPCLVINFFYDKGTYFILDQDQKVTLYNAKLPRYSFKFNDETILMIRMFFSYLKNKENGFFYHIDINSNDLILHIFFKRNKIILCFKDVIEKISNDTLSYFLLSNYSRF